MNTNNSDSQKWLESLGSLKLSVIRAQMKRLILDAYRLRSHRWKCIISFLGTANVKLGRWRTVGSTNALENHVIKGTWAERKAQPVAIRKLWPNRFSSVQFIHSVVSDFCDPIKCSTLGLPVHHQLPEPAQTHVH